MSKAAMQEDLFGPAKPVIEPVSRPTKEVAYFDPELAPTPGSARFNTLLAKAIRTYERVVDARYRMRINRNHWVKAVKALLFWRHDQEPEQMRWTLAAGGSVTLRIVACDGPWECVGEEFTLVVPTECRDSYRDVANLFEEHEEDADPWYNWDRRIGLWLNGEDPDGPEEGE